jgi:hypothetical protein
MACQAAPDPADWTCDDDARMDAICDCGCGIPDTNCGGPSCTEPGCVAAACEQRNGCAANVITASNDTCGNAPNLLGWTCPRGNYGTGDGCDCGCGQPDPDCAGNGCKSGRCFDDACFTCHDEEGKPYPCAAAEAGWDDDAQDTAGPQPSLCSGSRFGADDGCDCGCGGSDPDCGDEGCSELGCNDDDACDRTTDLNGRPIGFAPDDARLAWLNNNCDLASYGTGDGCDCGCGEPDPDCEANESCTTAACTDGDACEICNNGAGGYVECDTWTCDTGFMDADCDCGCGAIDPRCRQQRRVSCTEPGCEETTCQQCTDDMGDRAECGGEWEDDATEEDGAACDPKSYDLDGLCDCGCGFADPDCAEDTGCTGNACHAPGCEVCHDFSAQVACLVWTCPADSYGTGDGCNCGCGAPDPDCDGQGCADPGCNKEMCETCHDPFGRAVGCP